jgi:hypothetical protein
LRNGARVGSRISRHVVVQGGGRLLSCGAQTNEYSSFKVDGTPPLFDAMQRRAFHRDFRLRAKPCAEISIDGSSGFVQSSTSGMEAAPVYLVHA